MEVEIEKLESGYLTTVNGSYRIASKDIDDLISNIQNDIKNNLDLKGKMYLGSIEKLKITIATE